MMKNTMTGTEMNVVFEVTTDATVTRELIDFSARKVTVYKNKVTGDVNEIAYITNGNVCYENMNNTSFESAIGKLVFRVKPIKAADRPKNATRATKGEVEQRLAHMYEYFGVTVNEPTEATTNKEMVDMTTMTHEEFDAGMSNPNATLVIGDGGAHFETTVNADAIQAAVNNNKGDDVMNETTVTVMPIDEVNNDLNGTPVAHKDTQAQALAGYYAAMNGAVTNPSAAVGKVITKTNMPVEAKGDVNMDNNTIGTVTKAFATKDMYNALAQNRATFAAANNNDAVAACDIVKAAWDSGKKADYKAYKVAMPKKGLNISAPKNTNNPAPAAAPAKPVINNTAPIAPKAAPEWVGTGSDGRRFIAFTSNFKGIEAGMFIETTVGAMQYMAYNLVNMNGKVVQVVRQKGTVLSNHEVNAYITKGTVTPVKYSNEWALAHAIIPAAQVEETTTTQETVETEAVKPNGIMDTINNIGATAQGIGASIMEGAKKHNVNGMAAYAVTKPVDTATAIINFGATTAAELANLSLNTANYYVAQSTEIVNKNVNVLTARVLETNPDDESKKINNAVAGGINKVVDTLAAIIQFGAGTATGIGVNAVNMTGSLVINTAEGFNTGFDTCVKRIAGVSNNQ